MSEFIHFSWHASTPYGLEAGERAPTRQKDKPFSISESRDELACYAERTTDDKPSAEKACILCRGAKEEDEVN